MPRFGPIKRDDLIRYLLEFGFEGPLQEESTIIWLKGQHRLVIPNPHGGDISRELLSKILKQAGIERNEWEQK